MNADEMFNWPDGDVILRTTNGTESRDFRVHKSFLSFSSPVFKDMFKSPQPSSAASDGVEVVDVADPPRALELALRFVYPSATSPVIDDLTLLSEALILTDKYGIEVARSRLRSSFMEFTKTEPLRAYAVASRLRFEDEMKIASSHTTSIHLPGLSELPEEFKSIPATEYHRLILLHSRYRKEVEAIASHRLLIIPPFDFLRAFLGRREDEATMAQKRSAREQFLGRIREGAPLDHESLALALKTEKFPHHVLEGDIEPHISFILNQANSLNLTV